MFGALIICYLFLGGAGSGALMMLSVYELVDLLRRSKEDGASLKQPRFPEAFYTRSWAICLVVLIFAILCLAFDLGRIDRILAFVLSPQPTAVTIGAYSLFAATLCAAFFALAYLLEWKWIKKVVRRVVAILGLIAGIATALYAGLLLQGMVSILFWNSIFLPIIFFLSSISTGIACLFLGAVFTNSRDVFIGKVRKLARIDEVVIVVELVCLALYLGLSYFNPATEASAAALLFGDLSWAFWLGLVGCGLILPTILEWYVPSSDYRSHLLWICLFILIGGLLLRFCIVEAGMYDITQSPNLVFGVGILQ